MGPLHTVLAGVLEILGVVVILFAAVMWLKTAIQSRSTARAFMALVFTLIFFIVVILRAGEFQEATIRWLGGVYGGILVFYIIARMMEHREEIKTGQVPEVSNIPSRSIIMDEIESDSSIDSHGIRIRIKPGSLFRRRRAIQVFGSINSEEARDRVSRIAEEHAGDSYYVINDLTVQ